VAAQTTVAYLTPDARLYKYVRVPDGRWKYLRADYDDLFLKPHSVFLPKSNHPVHLEGGYYVASDEGKWHRLHEDPAEAWRLFRLHRVQGQMRELEATARTLTTKSDKKEAKPKVLTIRHAIERFLQSMNLKVASGGRKPRTYEAVEDVLMPFGNSLGMDEPLAVVTRESALTYIGNLKTKRGKDAKKTTKQNHFIYVQKMLRASGVDLFEEGDCPKAPSGSSEDIRVYSDEEIESLLSVASDYHRMCWKTFSQSGMREEELTHMYKRDVRRKADGSWILRVEGKPELRDWTPKTHEERDINIPAALAEELVEFSKRYMPESPLLFPTAPRHSAKGGKVNGKLLDALKRDAKAAGFNPEDFWLHGFRSTYATRCLRAKMDIADVRAQLGHAPGSNTIWKYVQAARGAERQAAVERVFAEPA
jgi:integrase